ncbi:MAG: MarR family winged helix-turn-helix transcriptional regulator [Planctomycetaceae bacterium]
MSDPVVRRAKTRRFDSLEQEVFLNLWRSYDRLRILEDELFTQHDLTPQQYNVLRVLRGSRPEPMPTFAIARRLVSRAPDVTRILDKLEARGLIERRRDRSNRRVVLVSITDMGLTLLHALQEAVRRCHAKQLGHMTRPDLETLARLLKEARLPHETQDDDWR